MFLEPLGEPEEKKKKKTWQEVCRKSKAPYVEEGDGLTALASCPHLSSTIQFSAMSQENIQPSVRQSTVTYCTKRLKLLNIDSQFKHVTLLLHTVQGV